MSIAEKLLKPIFSRVYKAKEKISDVIPRAFDKTSNFIFDKSSDIAVIMLFFNAVSLISSHLAQIGGLAKSKRENKDFLIMQEQQELGLDLTLSVVPPIMLHNFLKKKLESGEWQTKSYLDKAKKFLGPITGTEVEEFGNISHIRPLRETFYKAGAAISDNVLNKHRDLPEGINTFFNRLNEACHTRIPQNLPAPNMERIAAAFEDLKQNQEFPITERTLKRVNFRKNDAVKEFCNQNDGLLIMATIAYTILASNVIMPILKNKLAIRNYEKQLALKGETRESIKRKKRFAYNQTPPLNKPLNTNEGIFGDFYKISANQASNKLFYKDKLMEPKEINNTFSNFNQYYSQTNGLRI